MQNEYWLDAWIVWRIKSDPFMLEDPDLKKIVSEIEERRGWTYDKGSSV